MTKEEWLAELERVQLSSKQPDGFTAMDLARHRGCTVEYARVWINNRCLQGQVKEVGRRQNGKGISNVYQVVK